MRPKPHWKYVTPPVAHAISALENAAGAYALASGLLVQASTPSAVRAAVSAQRVADRDRMQARLRLAHAINADIDAARR